MFWYRHLRWRLVIVIGEKSKNVVFSKSVWGNKSIPFKFTVLWTALELESNRILRINRQSEIQKKSRGCWDNAIWIVIDKGPEKILTGSWIFFEIATDVKYLQFIITKMKALFIETQKSNILTVTWLRLPQVSKLHTNKRSKTSSLWLYQSLSLVKHW